MLKDCLSISKRKTEADFTLNSFLMFLELFGGNNILAFHNYWVTVGPVVHKGKPYEY